jgi:hypothetical protein
MAEELSQEPRERVLRALPHDGFAGPQYQVGLRRGTIAARTALDLEVVDKQRRCIPPKISAKSGVAS